MKGLSQPDRRGRGRETQALLGEEVGELSGPARGAGLRGGLLKGGVLTFLLFV